MLGLLVNWLTIRINWTDMLMYWLAYEMITTHVSLSCNFAVQLASLCTVIFGPITVAAPCTVCLSPISLSLRWWVRFAFGARMYICVCFCVCVALSMYRPCGWPIPRPRKPRKRPSTVFVCLAIRRSFIHTPRKNNDSITQCFSQSVPLWFF
jgi:hypothetical protein